MIPVTSRHYYLFLLACGLAALVPLLPVRVDDERSRGHFPGWPTHWQGRRLCRLSLSKREASFAANFPGRIARFSDGHSEYIWRWVTRATRKLHPADHCFQAVGYAIDYRPLVVGPNGERWRAFVARRQGERLYVREQIRDTGSQRWTDVSAWYWHAFFRRSPGPWWAITICEKKEQRQSHNYEVFINKYVSTAKNYAKKGMYKTAYLFILEALKIAPNHHEAIKLKQLYSSKLDDLESIKASSLPEEIIRSPKNLEAKLYELTNKGQQFYQNNEYKRAIRCFYQARDILQWMPYNHPINKQMANGLNDLIKFTKDKLRHSPRQNKN